MDIDKLSLRELQLESARALAIMQATNDNISKFNKEAHHNSQKWYKAVILNYIKSYGDFPSKVGPAKDIKLIMEN